MGVTLLNDSQRRRLSTHLRLLLSDLDALVWAARVEDLRARHLRGYGSVHPDLPRVLDPHVDALGRRLEALSTAANQLPDGDA